MPNVIEIGDRGDYDHRGDAEDGPAASPSPGDPQDPPAPLKHKHRGSASSGHHDQPGPREGAGLFSVAARRASLERVVALHNGPRPFSSKDLEQVEREAWLSCWRVLRAETQAPASKPPLTRCAGQDMLGEESRHADRRSAVSPGPAERQLRGPTRCSNSPSRSGPSSAPWIAAQVLLDHLASRLDEDHRFIRRVNLAGAWLVLGALVIVALLGPGPAAAIVLLCSTSVSGAILVVTARTIFVAQARVRISAEKMDLLEALWDRKAPGEHG